MDADVVIDDNLYSRQRYVLGDQAMKSMARSSVLISGLSGVGLEIAKNVALAGVRLLTVHDRNPVTWLDLSTVFYASPMDIGQNRAAVCQSQLAELNPYTKVRAVVLILNYNTRALKSFLSIWLKSFVSIWRHKPRHGFRDA